MSGHESAGFTGASFEQAKVAQLGEVSETNARLFDSAYSAPLKVAEAKPEAQSKSEDKTGETDAGAKSADKIQVGVNDPLKEFWGNYENSPVSIVDEVSRLDKSWKPFYEFLVESDGYQAIQDYRRATEGLTNHIQLMHPGRNDEVMGQVISYLKGEEGSEEQLNKTDPNLMQYSSVIRDSITNPEFHNARELADEMSGLVEYSIQAREILAEEFAKDGPVAIGIKLMYENSQMRRFLESTTTDKGFKRILNDSSNTG